MRHANLCIGRLQDRAIEYQVLRDEDHIRIVVRRSDLNDAIELLRDIAGPQSTEGPDRPVQRVALQVLIGIPVGSIAGAVFGSVLGADTIPWSVGGAIYLSTLLVALNAKNANHPERIRRRSDFSPEI